jgi:hypothetical protein
VINKNYWFITCDVSKLGISDGVASRDNFGRRYVSSVGSSERRLEGGGVNRANLKFINLSTTTSWVSVRNINESERGLKTNREQIKSETR